MKVLAASLVCAAASLVASLSGAQEINVTGPLNAPVEPPGCGSDGPWKVALTAGLGVAVGAGASLGSAGIASATDDTRDFDFGIGALVGIGVTTGLSAIYGIYDGSTNCEMARNSSTGVVWSVPIVMFVLGAALPVAVWGASDEIGAPAADDAMMESMRSRPPGLSWGFRF